MAEWFKAAVLKTAVGGSLPWVRIPPCPPFTKNTGPCGRFFIECRWELEPTTESGFESRSASEGFGGANPTLSAIQNGFPPPKIASYRSFTRLVRHRDDKLTPASIDFGRIPPALSAPAERTCHGRFPRHKTASRQSTGRRAADEQDTRRRSQIQREWQGRQQRSNRHTDRCQIAVRIRADGGDVR